MHTPTSIQVVEAVIVAASLIFLSLGVSNPVEWWGSAAVFVGFLHLQVQEEARVFAPRRTTVKFFAILIIREALWIAYFLLAGTYAAIIGSVVYAVFPFWRQLFYRTISRTPKDFNP